MGATNFDIKLNKYKNAQLVSSDLIVHTSADPGVGDFFGEIFDAISEFIKNTLSSVINLCVWGTIAGFLPIGGTAGATIGAAILAERFIKSFKETNAWIYEGINDVLNGSNWLCKDSQEITLYESDEFDSLGIVFHAHGDDEFTTYHNIYFPPVILGDPEILVHKDHNIEIVNWVLTENLMESGIYPFIFGARDSGFHFDVAGIVQLVIRWEKKTKPLVSTLRSINEHIDPPNPLRSLQEVIKIIDVYDQVKSLQHCFQELTQCRSVQASPLTIYWQNTALFPEGSIEIGLPEANYSLPLYEGRDRKASLNAFIDYLKKEKPDIVGLCEVWVPEDRNHIRDSLMDIYPYDDEYPNFFCLQGPIGDANVSINDDIPFVNIPNMDGGLMILSKYPILASGQLIYDSSWGEDSFASKGVLYAGIGVPGFPGLIHVFTTHLQSCPTGLDDMLPASSVENITAKGNGCDCETKKTIYQVQALRDFIQYSIGDGSPCIIMGDFNIDGLINNGYSDSYKNLKSTLGNVIDAWEDEMDFSDYGVSAFWPKCQSSHDLKVGFNVDVIEGVTLKAKTQGGNVNFKKDGSYLAWDDLHRWKGGSRIDFIFTRPGYAKNSGTYINFGKRRLIEVMFEQSNKLVNASDHYGLLINIQSIRVRA